MDVASLTYHTIPYSLLPTCIVLILPSMGSKRIESQMPRVLSYAPTLTGIIYTPEATNGEPCIHARRTAFGGADHVWGAVQDEQSLSNQSRKRLQIVLYEERATGIKSCLLQSVETLSTFRIGLALATYEQLFDTDAVGFH